MVDRRIGQRGEVTYNIGDAGAVLGYAVSKANRMDGHICRYADY